MHMNKLVTLVLLWTGIILTTCKTGKQETGFDSIWKDPAQPVDVRVKDLISKLTLEEKISQLVYDAPAIDRLGIPAYNWWSEALHGVARSGLATIFPQPVGMAASFDDSLLFEVANAISDEARAKFNEAIRIGNRGQNAGLTFWAPNINIFRDPRWGRGQETYGEDPYLTTRMGVAFVKGMQGDNPRYLKTAACAKHYVVHSGPEALRHEFNAIPPEKDFAETYLPAFEALVKEARVEAVMCAYNRTYGKPCCGSPFLLTDILRNQWGFRGHIVSDCWAISDFHGGHKVTADVAESAAMALNSGVNLNCGNEFPHLKEAVDRGLVTEAAIDSALACLLPTRFKLGLFDPAGSTPFDHIPLSVINSQEHRNLARKMASESIVLLKNDSNVLPLQREIRSLFVIGPYAANQDILMGNYNGVSGNLTTILEGVMQKVSPGTSVGYRLGTMPYKANVNPVDWASSEAQASDAIIAVFGISGADEGEEGESVNSTTRGDRLDLGLPAHQVEYLKKLRAAGNKPIILLLTGGSPICSPEIMELADAVLFVWYAGEEGGNAVADVIFGDENPAGRLPITFPKSAKQLPDFENYSMTGRTYRYMTEEPLFPFGFGLSYTSFAYSDLKLSRTEIAAGDSLQAEVTVKNTGNLPGDEVVQLYLTHKDTPFRTPLYALKGFRRVHLQPGQSRTVVFNLSPDMIRVVNNEGKLVDLTGEKQLTIGGSLPGERSLALGACMPVTGIFRIKE
jgi:beta-glucosidase